MRRLSLLRFFASRSCTCLSAHDARQWGPCAAAKVRREKPEGWATGRGPVCCQRRRRCQQTAGAPSRSRRAGCPETAAPGWPFFWLLFFGHAKKSDPLAWRRAENRQGRRPPTKQHPTNIVTQAERAGRAPSGPLCRGEGAQERPEGWATGRGPVRCRRRRRRQRTPGAPSRSRRAGCPETAAPGWPFFWLLFFGHAKKSDPLAGASGKQAGKPTTYEAATAQTSSWLRRSRRSCGAVATQRKVTRSPGGEWNKAGMPPTDEARTQQSAQPEPPAPRRRAEELNHPRARHPQRVYAQAARAPAPMPSRSPASYTRSAAD
jgi:hypothetical protein